MASTTYNFLGDTSNYIRIDTPPTPINPGTSDFTIEWWQYETDTNPYPRVFSSGSYPTCEIGLSQEGGYLYFWSGGSANFITYYPDTSYYLNTWLHYAIVRNAGITTIYRNGFAINAFNDTHDYILTETLTIGNETTMLNDAAFGGNIYNFMWLLGTAKYNADFTPCTSLPCDPQNYAIILDGINTALYSSDYAFTLDNNKPVANVCSCDPTPPPVQRRHISSNSFGQFWYGRSLGFPGFIYKKNVGVGGRRSTKMVAGGTSTSNTYQYIYNKYNAGNSGIGAQSVANRRAKNRLATVCNAGKCGSFYTYLGLYDNYTGNPNGYFPFPTPKTRF